MLRCEILPFLADDLTMRVPDAIRDCVVFVGIRDESGNVNYRGTAFLVSVKGDSGISYLYLVTARHIAERVEGLDFVVKVNRKNGDPVVFQGNETRWWYHPTHKKEVDAAATFFGPPAELKSELDIRWFPSESFVTDQILKERNIGVGDQVFITGLFTKVQETSRNIPIVRIGNIAMMPGEKIPFGESGLIEACLVESRSIGGLSGSPVFVRETLMLWAKFGDKQRAMHGAGEFFLLGSMLGHWELRAGSLSLVEGEAVNMGISVVVPAQRIMDILVQPELIELRKKWDAEQVKKPAITSE
jgi:hypothetical protein